MLPHFTAGKIIWYTYLVGLLFWNYLIQVVYEKSQRAFATKLQPAFADSDVNIGIQFNIASEYGFADCLCAGVQVKADRDKSSRV